MKFFAVFVLALTVGFISANPMALNSNDGYTEDSLHEKDSSLHDVPNHKLKNSGEKSDGKEDKKKGENEDYGKGGKPQKHKDTQHNKDAQPPCKGVNPLDKAKKYGKENKHGGLDALLSGTVKCVLGDLLDGVNDILCQLGLKKLLHGVVVTIGDTLGSLLETIEKLIACATVQEIFAQVTAPLNKLVCAILELIARIIPAVENLLDNVTAIAKKLLCNLEEALSILLINICVSLDGVIDKVGGLQDYVTVGGLCNLKTAIKNARREVHRLFQCLMKAGLNAFQLGQRVIEIICNFHQSWALASTGP